MSHLVSIRTQIRDPVALASACAHLGILPPRMGTAQLYAESATGHIVNLPGWHYPVVIDTATCDVHYDNYNGAWGDPKELDKLLQRYAVEKATLEARKAGHSVVEYALPDGSIKLTLTGGTL